VKNCVVKVLIPALLGLAWVQGSPRNFWHVLAEVGFEKVRNAGGYEVEVPRFSNHLKTFDRKPIQLKGYVIPVDEAGTGKFMFSMLPFNVCYFCGAAGPETVVEVETTEKIEFTTQAVTLTGTLRLNPSDPDRHIYILQNARLLKK
jgi:hypothetical protein